jgi:hypothetical protein
VRRGRGGAFALAMVAAETIEHELDHVTLAMMRRGHVRKYEQLHAKPR